MNYILSTEFSCKSCGHTGHFKQGYHGSKVSDVATCPRCNDSFDVSRARSIEKWNQTISFSMFNSSYRTAILRLGGKQYDIPPNSKVRVSHRGNDLFEYKYEDNVWQPSTSVWFFCYNRDWESEIDVSAYAHQDQASIQKSSKKSWW